MNKTEEKELIKKLRRKCYFLWRAKVINNAEGRCEYCETTKKLNAHHIESYSLNKDLRYDPRNGMCLCVTHHKFGRFSSHKSFIFMHRIMNKKRFLDLLYLDQICELKNQETIESLKATENKLQPNIGTIPQLLKRKK